MTAVMILCCMIAGSILGRAALIQIGRDQRLETLARRQFQSKVLIRPRRGLILDRSGEPLAVNSEARSLAANPAKLANKRNFARLLSHVTEIPFPKLLERLKEKREFVWIKRHLSEAELSRLRKWRLMGADGELVEGLWLVREDRRVYPHQELAAHVLGDVNLDSEGLEGVELWADEKLRGKVVSVSAYKDALGRPAFIDAVAARHVKDGESVTLTIDASLQYSAEQELHNAVTRTGSRGGTVIVMNAVTGEILALANHPSFNPNDPSVPAARRRNRAVTDGYEPGSTLKSVLLASALSNGWKLGDVIWGERGSFLVQGKRISEAEAHERFEWLNLKRVIQHSSNVGAAKIALKLGADRYLATLKAFGFGARTGSGFPGEIPGRIPPRKAWQPLSLANIGFGQGILVTPLQIARAYAVFANGGWLVQPTLFKTAREEGAEPPRRILGQKAVDGVVDALVAATEEKDGTGVKATIPGYRVAGKTGTAQVVDPATGKYSRSRYIGSFVGFATGVEPRLVIFTALDEPKGVYYGAETAAPLFRGVLQAAANRFSLPAAPEKGMKGLIAASESLDRIAASQAHPAPAAEAVPSVRWHGNAADGTVLWKMPELHGLSVRETLRALGGHKFRLEVRGAGVVRSQSPEAGKPIADGGLVRITLADP
jgi:cell division protein FtsI (penicillin-binding protein 3)